MREPRPPIPTVPGMIARSTFTIAIIASVRRVASRAVPSSSSVLSCRGTSTDRSVGSRESETALGISEA